MIRISPDQASRFAVRCAGKAALGTATLATRSAMTQVLDAVELEVARAGQTRANIGHYDRGALLGFDFVQVAPLVRRAHGLVYAATMDDEKAGLSRRESCGRSLVRQPARRS